MIEEIVARGNVVKHAPDSHLPLIEQIIGHNSPAWRRWIDSNRNTISMRRLGQKPRPDWALSGKPILPVDKIAPVIILNERSGHSSVWLERTVRDREVGGSNPLAPTFFRHE